MTSIEKMQIRGIRSFSPDNTQIIEFFKPLTLIVGKNGSGKTTIIECLKMSTTGDLPPNCRSGQAFINDPNVYGKSEVKAQIKLKLTAATGKPAVCQRSFSLTQKPQRREYKAFEAALQTLDERNEKSCLSYKCADLNKLVPELMGVSTAVLESVIFVHQEDSCWPLSEDKVLKQRFDDIFAATNYTKALDNIKAYRLEKSKDIRVLAAQLDALEVKLKTATRLREELKQAQEMQEEIRANISEAQAKTREAKDKMPALQSQIDEHNRLKSELYSVVQEHTHAMEVQEEASKQIEASFGSHLSETDDELRELEGTRGYASTQLTADLDTIKRKCTELERGIEQAEVNRDKARGKLEQEKAVEQHNRRTESEAALMIEGFESKYNIAASRLTASATPAEHSQTALDSLTRVQQSRQSELDRAKEERQTTTNSLLTRVQQMRIEVDHSQGSANEKDREASALVTKQRQLQDRLDADGAMGDEATLMRLTEEVKDLRSQAAVAREELQASNLSETIAGEKVRRGDLKHKQGSLGEELANIEREGDKLERLRRHEKAVADKKQKLDFAVTERYGKFRDVLDVTSAEDVMNLLDRDTLLRELTRKRVTREEERDGKERELQHEKGKEQQKVSALISKQEALRTIEDQVGKDEQELRATEPLMLQESYNFEDRQRALEEASQKANEEYFNATTLVSIMAKAKAKAESHHKCMVCQQHTGPDAVKAITQRWDAARAADQTQAKEAVRVADERTKKHKRAGELFSVMKKRKTTEMHAVKAQIESKRAEAAEMKRVVDIKEAEFEELRKRANIARDLDKEWMSAQAEVASIQSGMQSGMHTAMRSKESVMRDREDAQNELDALEKRIEQDGAELDRRRGDLSEVATKTSAKELELNRLQASMERRRDMEKQLAEFKASISALQANAAKLRDNQRPLQQKLAHAEEELRGEEHRLDAGVRDLDAAVADCMRDHTKLNEFVQRLAQAGSSHRQQLMADCQTRLEDSEKQVTEKRGLLREKLQKRSVLNEKLQGQDKLRVQMTANLHYREQLRKERGLHGKVKGLQDKIQGISAAAQAAERERIRCVKVINECEMENAKLSGSIATVSANETSLKAQLKDKLFLRVDVEHREKLIEHKTVAMVVEDLNKYYKALNAALMKFHETKMEDINKSITELWNKTYKGSDIDGIAIKTEDEGQTVDGRRKTAYRVVMRKGDTHLDMRGRCSAGQRVLASLVIRLALAETFCINCGILALDEPTTNLDAANVESLAQAINEIIKSRKAQANFQLIVITHDEGFVQQIGRSESASHYFHVEKRFIKDGDPPASTITKKAIEQFG